MDSFKNKIIENILNLLKQNNISNDEVLKIKNDLERNNIDNLVFLINNQFQDINCSKEIKQFVKSLIESELISEDYLLKIYNISYTNINNRIIFFNSKPLQLKREYYYELNKFRELTNHNINKNVNEKSLREKIIEARTNYLDDPTGFIANLELMDAESIYKTFMDSHDITLIQHCISKLSANTLNRLLVLVESKINLNHYDVLSIFIQEAIKRNMHNKKIA